MFTIERFKQTKFGISNYLDKGQCLYSFSYNSSFSATLLLPVNGTGIIHLKIWPFAHTGVDMQQNFISDAADIWGLRRAALNPMK